MTNVALPPMWGNSHKNGKNYLLLYTLLPQIPLMSINISYCIIFLFFIFKVFSLSFEKTVLTSIKIYSSVFFFLNICCPNNLFYLHFFSKETPSYAIGWQRDSHLEQKFANYSSIQTFCGAFIKKILVCTLHSSIDSIWEAQVWMESRLTFFFAFHSGIA